MYCMVHVQATVILLHSSTIKSMKSMTLSQFRYSLAVHDLIRALVNVEMSKRPFINEVLESANKL